jgi:hypothetical protein
VVVEVLKGADFPCASKVRARELAELAQPVVGVDVRIIRVVRPVVGDGEVPCHRPDGGGRGGRGPGHETEDRVVARGEVGVEEGERAGGGQVGVGRVGRRVGEGERVGGVGGLGGGGGRGVRDRVEVVRRCGGGRGGGDSVASLRARGADDVGDSGGERRACSHPAEASRPLGDFVGGEGCWLVRALTAAGERDVSGCLGWLFFRNGFWMRVFLVGGCPARAGVIVDL